MRARIRTCVGMHNIFYYNEKKVADREAECIYAGNFLQDPEQLTRHDKKQRFEEQLLLNQQTRRSAVSVVLEFAPGEKLEKDDLIDIARDIMQGIGYERQPYLVYRHDDTAHQHLHIISTKIRHDGNRIPESFIGVRLLQPARKAAEEKYGLAKTTAKGQKRHDPREKVQYGKEQTWQAMADTLKYVVETYRYRSLQELNAVLSLYNLTVKGGRKGTRLNDHRGLIYQVIDETGKVRNAPVKASDFDFKPTLDNLEKRFSANTAQHLNAHRPHTALDHVIDSQPQTHAQFADLLRRNRLALIPPNAQQTPANPPIPTNSPTPNASRMPAAPQTVANQPTPDLFVVDLTTNTVLTPADLGNDYTATAIRQRLGFDPFTRTPMENNIRNTETQQLKPQHKRGLHH